MEESKVKTAEFKETFGVEIGDKVLCRWEDWTEDVIRNRKVTCVVFAIDHNDTSSDDWATFHLIQSNGYRSWFCGEPSKIISKGNKLPKNITI